MICSFIARVRHGCTPLPPPWSIEELDACLSATTADRHSPMYITGMSRDGERG